VTAFTTLLKKFGARFLTFSLPSKACVTSRLHNDYRLVALVADMVQFWDVVPVDHLLARLEMEKEGWGFRFLRRADRLSQRAPHLQLARVVILPHQQA
jgi:hypothetical protein